MKDAGVLAISAGNHQTTVMLTVQLQRTTQQARAVTVLTHQALCLPAHQSRGVLGDARLIFGVMSFDMFFVPPNI